MWRTPNDHHIQLTYQLANIDLDLSACRHKLTSPTSPILSYFLKMTGADSYRVITPDNWQQIVRRGFIDLSHVERHFSALTKQLQLATDPLKRQARGSPKALCLNSIVDVFPLFFFCSVPNTGNLKHLHYL